MGDVAALRVAIDLLHLPSRARHLRSSPLPDGVVLLLRIASGDPAAIDEGALLSGRPREIVFKASAFFIEQILLFPGADSYRVLGADRNATAAGLRRNMALIFRWLHPDIDQKGEQSIFARRVTRAWDDLKTPERRAVYDKGLHALRKKNSRSQHKNSKQPRNPKSRLPTARANKSYGIGRNGHAGLLRRFMLVLFGRTLR